MADGISVLGPRESWVLLQCWEEVIDLQKKWPQEVRVVCSESGSKQIGHVASSDDSSPAYLATDRPRSSHCSL